ncbi:EpsI family protein [Marinobacter lipolyticus]|uniref:exosortase A n=1 Tax=Marinobacter lipolyticus TaxID=209639 RepID=UPI001BCF4B7D|nr:exosortase A [Marinobacter lipolyticus]MBS8238983.1 EpsI family protein [Marinobacter lipolyticus]
MSVASRSSHQYLWLLAIPVLVLALWAEWRDFFQLWYDSIIYTHGYLVLAGVLYLLYLRRDALAGLTITGSGIALFLLTGASALLLFAQAADIRFIRLILVPFLILFWGWSIWGKGFVTTAGGPILLLLFAAPFWDDFSPLLQHITVFFNTFFLNLADIEATIREFYIELEVGTFLVENGCSGVRYLMVALFLGSFYGQLYYRSFPRTALLVVIAGLLSMVANWLRVFGIIAAGHYTNMETSLVEDHELFGWIVFLLVTLIPLFFIAGKLEVGSAIGTSQPSSETSPRADDHGKGASWIWPIAASVLILWPALIPLAVEARTDRLAHAWNPILPSPAPDWRGPLPHANIWRPDYQKPDIDLSGVYVSGDLQQLQLQITGYRRQTQNKELIFYGNELFDRSDWRLISTRKRELPASFDISPPRVNETIIERRADGVSVILWSWYDIGSSLTDSRLEAKITGALKKIGGDNRGALWALASYCKTPETDGCTKQRATFTRFLAGVER